MALWRKKKILLCSTNFWVVNTLAMVSFKLPIWHSSSKARKGCTQQVLWASKSGPSYITGCKVYTFLKIHEAAHQRFVTVFKLYLKILKKTWKKKTTWKVPLTPFSNLKSNSERSLTNSDISKTYLWSI